jgi:hypothetical protein
MHHKTLKQLNTLRDNLSELHENSTDKLIESTNSNDLQNEIQRNVINYITETIKLWFLSYTAGYPVKFTFTP